AAARVGARDEAVRTLGPALQQVGTPDGLPLRARLAVVEAAAALGLSVPTAAPTAVSTRAPQPTGRRVALAPEHTLLQPTFQTPISEEELGPAPPATDPPLPPPRPSP